MLLKFFLAIFAIPVAIAAVADNQVSGLQSLEARGKDTAGWFHPPKTKHFISLDVRVFWPANVTNPLGIVGSVGNCRGGTVTGAIEGNILPVGAAFERAFVHEYGETGFYENRYHILTPKNETFLLEVQGILTYESGASLHGFGYATFRTSAKGFGHINYKPYAFEVGAQFNTGEGHADVFELVTSGLRKDPHGKRGLEARQGPEEFDNVERACGSCTL